MARNFNASSANVPANGGTREFTPADKWVNISLPTVGGQTRQLIGIPLSMSDARQAKLIAMIEAKGIEAFQDALVVEYRDGKPSPDSDFAF